MLVTLPDKTESKGMRIMMKTGTHTRRLRRRALGAASLMVLAGG